MKSKFRKDSPAFRVSLTGIAAALTLTVSLLEKTVTAGLPLPPGVKPGLGNVAVMIICFSFGPVYAFSVILIKSAFMLIVSGVTSSFISFCGGFLSVTVMALIHTIAKDRTGPIWVSVTGAICHNTGQLIAASIIVESSLYLNYAPVLILSGVLCGVLTGIILRYTFPAVSRLIKK